MSKTIIEVKCIDQVLTLTNTPVIASGGQGEDYVHFDLCEKWDGFAVSGVFWRKGVDCIPVLLDADNTCQVPPELMTSEGVIYFGAVGVAPDGTTRTSEPVSYLIREGVITENTALPIPGEDVYQQLMAYYADVKLYVSTRIDEAANAAVQAGGNAQAALAAAEQAERHAEDAVDAIEGVIYPGIVEATLDDGANTIGVKLDNRPPDKMFLTFRAPALYDTTYDEFYLASLRVRYPGNDGTETREVFWLRDGWQSKTPDNAIRPYDVVTVLLTRVGGSAVAYIVNPRITQTALDEMNQRFYPGIPASVTADKVMTIALDYVPEDKMVLVFTADANASGVDKFQLEYETVEDGLVQVEYALSDGYGSPIYWQAFNKGDHVSVLLTPADKMATVLNPRITSLVRSELDGQKTKMDERVPDLNIESYSYNGALGITVKSVPVDGSVIRFKAALASEDITHLRIPNLGVNYDLVDTDGNPACNGVHTFGVGSYVAVLMDVTNQKAYVLNPARKSVETIQYSGNGQYRRSLLFTNEPKIVLLLCASSAAGAGEQAIFVKDFNICKYSYLDASGNYKSGTLSTTGKITWGKEVVISVGDLMGALMFNNGQHNYIAIGIM